LKDSKGHDKVFKFYAKKVFALFGFEIKTFDGDKTEYDKSLLK
jgi:hypothetical protein